MAPLLDWIAKYLECKKRIEREMKKDSENTSYDTQYESLKNLSEANEVVKKNLENLSPDDVQFHRFNLILSSNLSQIGTIYMDLEEFAKAEDYFMECLATVSDPLHPDFIVISILTRNQLGFLWSHRSQPDTAKKYLKEAENLYKSFKRSKDEGVKPLQETEADESEDREKILEMSHTLTKYYLAQIYRTLNKLVKSIIYFHETLKRELLYEKYDAMNWAENSAILSQIFVERALFKQARHHLAAASCVLDGYEKTLEEMEGSQEEIDFEREQFCQKRSNVSRFWAKYGIFILEHSKNLQGDPEKETSEEENEGLENLEFDSLDLSEYEKQITDSPVETFEEAREVFLVTQKHINKAKEYYTLEDRASDHVQIVQDHSLLFRYLAAFEPNEERQYKMMKRRVDMLKAVLKELNPNYYLGLCRQLWFELGETYQEMTHMKYQKMSESNERPTPQTLRKINTLAEYSINYFNCFLDSVKDRKTDKFPESLPEDLLRPTLIAHFYLGRLHYKYITDNVQKQKENLAKACESFKFLVDVCEKHDKARDAFREELSISEEMVTLLQMKLLKL